MIVSFPSLSRTRRAGISLGHPRIALDDICGLAVHNIEQAKNEIVRLRYLQIPEARIQMLNFFIAPDLYDKHKLSNSLKRGERPDEKPFNPRTVK
jgi:hypothetical protein